MERGKSSRYRIVLACDGIPPDRGLQTVADAAEGFMDRPWHENVECKWSDDSLLLSAENDYDPHGLALMDELGCDLYLHRC
jgi:hypothetical protein